MTDTAPGAGPRPAPLPRPPAPRRGGRLSVRWKLVGAFGVSTLAAASLGIAALVAIWVLGDLVKRMYEEPLQAINFARSAETRFARMELANRELNSADKTKIEAQREKLQSLTEDFLGDLQIAEERGHSQPVAEQAAIIKKLYADWLKAATAVLDMSQPAAERTRLIADREASAAEIFSNLEILTQLVAADGYVFWIAAEAAVEKAKSRTLMVIGALGIVIVGVAFLLIRDIVVPLNSLTQAMFRLAAGDGTVEVPHRQRKDEIGRMGHALGVFKSAMNDVREARERAEAATKAKSEFLAMMSHEIRTPMTAILGFAELLGSPDATPLQRAECARTIGRHGEHLVSIINDILDLSKLEAGRMTLERAPCNAMVTLRDVVDLYVPRGANKGLRVELVQETPIPETITTDPTRFRQAVMNLVSNAVKFTERGSVRVGVAAEGEPGSECLVVRVIDTGIGLSEAQAACLFQPFVQADDSTTRRFGGTGLGLSITRRLAQMLGGDVTVTSTPGQGSTFTLRVSAAPCSGMLPAPQGPSDRSQAPDGHREPAREAPAEPASGSPRRTALSARVLLADDAPDNRRLFAHHLGRAGAAVDVVADGQSAVDRALDAWRRHRAYDAVILDVQMPELDGVQAVGALRAQGYRGLVIALSADAMTESRQRGLDAGFDEYLTKPIAGSVFIDAIRAALDRAGASV